MIFLISSGYGRYFVPIKTVKEGEEKNMSNTGAGSLDGAGGAWEGGQGINWDPGGGKCALMKG